MKWSDEVTDQPAKMRLGIVNTGIVGRATRVLGGSTGNI